MRTRQEGWNMQKFQGTADMINQEALINEKAAEIHCWIQDAVGDIAYGMDPEDIKESYGKKLGWQAKHIHRDWLADELYSDPDVLQDLCGDRLFDAATEICGTSNNPEHPKCFISIANRMKERSHSALIEALDKLIERHNKN